MPFIGTKTSVAISEEKKTILKARLGKAIECLPGKNESWLMLSFEDNVSMYFKGDNSAPTAMIEVKIFGKSTAAAYEKMTAAVCGIFQEELAIPPERIYVKYEECSIWGWNGGNF